MEGIKYGRKSSGIKKQLNTVLHNWIRSIDDDNLQLLLHKNTIVTGGSICSMLMGDPVNDYDVYFKNKDTAIAVAQYYMTKHFDTPCPVIYTSTPNAGHDKLDTFVHVYETDNIKANTRNVCSVLLEVLVLRRIQVLTVRMKMASIKLVTFLVMRLR